MSVRVLCSAVAAIASAASLVVFAGCSGSGSDVSLPTSTPTQLAASATPTPSRTLTSTPVPTPNPTLTSTPVPTPTSTPSVVAGLYHVSGRLIGIASDFTVALRPTGRTTRSADMAFAFDDVPPGNYTIDVDDFCGEFPCFADTPVTVLDRDVSVDLTNDLCPPPALTASSGPPGATVGAHGRCYYFHSGRQGNVFFDEVQVGKTSPGDTPGNYGAGFQIPLDASPGSHTISFVAGPSPATPGVSVPFLVTGGP